MICIVIIMKMKSIVYTGKVGIRSNAVSCIEGGHT